MSKIEIPSQLLSKLGPEMKMDVHWIDVLLKDNKKHYGVVVRGGKFITGLNNDHDGVNSVGFSQVQIKNIGRRARFKWWPLW
ncbi:MAG: hypothetical protein KUG79_15985 [Pseudomonadales bacterium]|nr:hypothetical protein [Pseudomonadales bacterium]